MLFEKLLLLAKEFISIKLFLMHFISVLNFCMFMMIVKIFCCTIYFAFHFLPKLISSPFSGSGRNCGVLWPRQIEGASPCFLGCCILSEDMRVWGGIWAVCVCARACGGLSLPPSHFDSSTLRIRVTGTSDKWDKLSPADHHCGLSPAPRAWRANSKDWKTGWCLTTCGELGCHSQVLKVGER